MKLGIAEVATFNHAVISSCEYAHIVQLIDMQASQGDTSWIAVLRGEESSRPAQKNARNRHAGTAHP
jgi:hypothetical protein